MLGLDGRPCGPADGARVSLTRPGVLPILRHLRASRHRVNWFCKHQQAEN